MSENVHGLSTKLRGTSLLEAFESCLPKFDSFDEEQHLKFVKVMHMLSDYFKISENRFQSETLSQIQPLIDSLQQLYDRYRDNDDIIASAILVTMTHIQSYYLDDQDAKLVHNLTGLHIYSPIQWLEWRQNDRPRAP